MPLRVTPASPTPSTPAPWAAACGRPRTRAAPGFPSPMKAFRSARLEPSRLLHQTPTSSTWAPASPISAARTPTALACLNPPTRARPGATSASKTRARLDAWSWTRRTRTAFMSRLSAIFTIPMGSVESIARPTAGPPGRRCSSRPARPIPLARLNWPSIPSIRVCFTLRCGRRAGRRGPFMRPPTCPAAGCTSPPTAAIPGSN